MQTLPLSMRIRARKRFLALFLCAGLLSATAAVYFVRYLVKPITGLAVYYPEVRVEDDRIIYSPMASSSPVREAGIIPEHDRIIAVNSIPLLSVRQLVLWDAGYYSFEPFRLTVEDEAGNVREVTVKPEQSVRRVDWFFVLFFLVILGGTAFYILIHHHNEFTQVLFGFLALGYMVYTSILPFYYESVLTFFFANLGELTAWFVILFLAFFQKDVFPKFLKKMIVAAVLAIGLATVLPRMYFFFRWEATGENELFTTLKTIVTMQNTLDVIAYILFIIALLIIYFRTKRTEIKHHIEWITAGALLALPPHFFFNQLPHILGNEGNVLPFMGNTSHLFLAFLPLSYIVGLAQSRGYRLKIFQTRSIIHLFMAFLLLGFFTILYQPVQVFFTNVLKLSPDISGFLVAVTLFIVALYLQLVMLFLMEKKFMKELRYDPTHPPAEVPDRTEHHLPAALREFHARELETLLERYNKRVDDSLRAIRKASLDSRNLFTREVKSRTVDSPDESPESGRDSYGGKCFNLMQTHLIALERFRKRFDVLTDRRASVHISISIDVLLSNAVAQSKRQWPGVEFEYFPARRMKVYCSPEEITICLLIVIENAWESRHDKSEKILIAARPYRESAAIEIRDRGSGISQKNLLQVGQPFFTTKKNHDGLSLYFMKKLLERNAGHFRMEPAPDSGAAVFLFLPRTRSSGTTYTAERE